MIFEKMSIPEIGFFVIITLYYLMVYYQFGNNVYRNKRSMFLTDLIPFGGFLRAFFKHMWNQWMDTKKSVTVENDN